jgi:hypothetical protein
MRENCKEIGELKEKQAKRYDAETRHANPIRIRDFLSDQDWLFSEPHLDLRLFKPKHTLCTVYVHIFFIFIKTVYSSLALRASTGNWKQSTL